MLCYIKTSIILANNKIIRKSLMKLLNLLMSNENMHKQTLSKELKF